MKKYNMNMKNSINFADGNGKRLEISKGRDASVLLTLHHSEISLEERANFYEMSLHVLPDAGKTYQMIKVLFERFGVHYGEIAQARITSDDMIRDQKNYILVEQMDGDDSYYVRVFNDLSNQLNLLNTHQTRVTLNGEYYVSLYEDILNERTSDLEYRGYMKTLS